jgi:hypothetical protein
MIVGDPYRARYNASNMEDRAINFSCLDYANTSAPAPTSQFPQRNCRDGLRLEAYFPSCWDGKNLDSPDHKSHMAYPLSTPDSGYCPPSHPVKTILLFNEYLYDVVKFDFVAGKDSWILAQGDVTGLGFHSDFINGWKQSTLEAAVAQCGTAQIFGSLESE